MAVKQEGWRVTKEWLRERTAVSREHPGCRIWTLRMTHDGQARANSIYSYATGKRTSVSVKKIAFWLKHGRLPREGYIVQASCGVRGCVCEDHMVERTLSESRKGRPKSLPWRAKMSARRRQETGVTQEMIDEMISTAGSETGRSVARRLGVDESTVSSYRNGVARRHYGGIIAQLMVTR